MYKTNTDRFFIRGMVENYCTLGKIQPWPTIHPGDNNFPLSPHEQSIFVYYIILTIEDHFDNKTKYISSH